MPNCHLKLINDICEYDDIVNKIIDHIDFEEMERLEKRRREARDAIHKRRWRRGHNYYDSKKYSEVGR